MTLQNICYGIMILTFIISFVEIALMYAAYMKYEKKGMLVTNNHITSEMWALVAICILTIRMTRKGEWLDQLEDERIKYTILICIFVVAAIYMLSLHGYIKKQYVFGDMNFCSVGNELSIMPYSYIQAMYSDSRKPYRKILYINYKLYIMEMNEETYEAIKEKLSPKVKQNSERLDGGDSSLNKIVAITRAMGIVVVVGMMGVAIVYATMEFSAEIMKCVMIAFFVFVMLILAMYAVVNQKKKEIVKRIIDGETV